MASMAVMDGVNTADSLWERMAGLRFKINDHVTIHPVAYRGEQFYLLKNGFDQKQYRLNNRTYQLLSKMDGHRTLAQACNIQIEIGELTKGAYRKVLEPIAQLQAAGLLVSDVPRQAEAIVAQHKQQRSRARITGFMRLLSPRYALLNPDRFLANCVSKIPWMFNKSTFLLWIAIALYATFQVLISWDALSLYGAQRLGSVRLWLIMVCVYPVLKALHEIGHGLAAKYGGASVNEMGITFLVFVPVPYVDASAVSSFTNKYQRMLVGAAGIMMEVFLASMAVFVWMVSDDSLVRDIAFSVMLISGVSTVIFNGNPLLRFDGYYVLMDALEIPDLGTRSSRYYRYLAKRYLLGLHAENTPELNDGERRWFVLYGFSSSLYRVFICLGIAAFLYISVPVFGPILALWLVGVQLVYPAFRAVAFLLFNNAMTGQRINAAVVVLGGLSALVGILSLPVYPSSTVLEGVVLLPQNATVRAKVDGFLRTANVSDKARIQSGDSLFHLDNPTLKTELQIQELRVKELDARFNLQGLDDRLSRDIQAQRLYDAQAQLDELQQRHKELVVRSTGTGHIRLNITDDTIGQYIEQGGVLGYIVNETETVIRVVATQSDASRIRNEVLNVDVLLLSQSGEVLSGKILNEVPLASDTLPSSALGSYGGGAIQVDARDTSGMTALERVFAIDVVAPVSGSTNFMGSRALVRFHHQNVSLLPHWYQSVRQIVIEKLQL